MSNVQCLNSLQIMFIYIYIMKKEICKIMKEQGLNITVKANQNLSEIQMISLFTSMHIAQSNHAPAHIKNIPINVDKRLNMLSCK